MVAITRTDSPATATAEWPEHAALIDLRHGALATELSANELLVAEALLSCMGQWGLAKTTMDDIARAAGLSRATVYRLFPGGKAAILDAAAHAEVRGLAGLLVTEMDAAPDVEACLVAAIHTAATFLHGHAALAFVRAREPLALDRMLSFERLDLILQTSGTLLARPLGRFVPDHDRAVELGVWIARVVVSHLSNPSPSCDLTARSDVTDLVRTFVLPGLVDLVEPART